MEKTPKNNKTGFYHTYKKGIAVTKTFELQIPSVHLSGSSNVPHLKNFSQGISVMFERRGLKGSQIHVCLHPPVLLQSLNTKINKAPL